MPASALVALALLASARANALAPHAANQRELGPFLLNQYRENLETKLGKPTREEKDGDGNPTLFYSLAGEMDTFMAFTVVGEGYAHIVSIQLSGKPMKGLAPFNGVTLGDSRDKVMRAFGEPTETKTVDSGEFVTYDDRNYSFVFAEGKLISIKITATEIGYPKKDDVKPDLPGFQRALESRDHAAILDYLCADFYVRTKEEGNVEFKGAAREELNDEGSLVARYLYGGAGSVRELLTAEGAKTPVTERDGWESGPRPVNAISSSGPLYEVVWNFEAGRWRVWEIALKSPEDEDDPGGRSGRTRGRFRR